MIFNFFKDNDSAMKKKESKENIKDIKDKTADFNAEYQDTKSTSEKDSSNGGNNDIQDEVLLIPDEKAILEGKVTELENGLKEMTDKFLRLSAEFDNYRKRTLRERIELTKTASESVLLGILPVIDDFERAMKSIEQGLDFEATKEGILLIYNKFNEFSKQNGITEINAAGQLFDTALHEALTKIPAPPEDMKGKIVDVIQKGYYLNDKVIRFAKVVVGE
jgi:molecular chaperone GrpE